VRHKWVGVFLSLTILAAPSVMAGQSPSVVWSPATQQPSLNPLFPERVGIPWFGVPQLGPYPKSFGMPSSSTQLSPPLSFPANTRTTGQESPLPVSFIPEILYVGNVPIAIFPLPLPPNPIVARLQSFGFLLQVPMIKSPVENSGNW
jgi:hypothetical protein